ncbi:MAG: hypothetical protein IPI49_19640 [Myxococcales bacterium]|nr:hypothetical protein [Myxococcales bacterium]
MKGLRVVIAHLRREVLAVSPRRFEAARTRQPELAPHEDAASVLAVLADSREDTYPARDALSAALLREHQLQPKGPWRSLLVVAFEPMLGHLRGRLVSTVPGDELDQTVICSFLLAVDELAPRNVSHHVPIRLRQRTQRHVFRFLRKERQEEHDEADFERLAAQEAEPDVAPGEALATGQGESDLKELLRRGWEVGLSPQSKRVVQATVLDGMPLRKYVAQCGPDSAEAREQLYQRLKRARSRALRRLRWFAEHPPPQLAFRFGAPQPATESPRTRSPA